MWPLTHDFEANPFRYDAETGRGSPLLWHCILALSYKHIYQKTGQSLAEAKAHKRKATQLLEELESDPHSPTAQGNLLDALLILMTLDCATSAQGPWVSHLNRAHKILEAIHLLRIPKTPRMQAQIDMLVWYVYVSMNSSRPFSPAASYTDPLLPPGGTSPWPSLPVKALSCQAPTLQRPSTSLSRQPSTMCQDAQTTCSSTCFD